MISKGTTHNNGARLATYMTTGKKQERAELWQLRGFVATNIKDAFRDVQIMAGATKCVQPIFHLQVRNREGEALSRQQWEYTADRIERMLGLSEQPRAISFHIDERTGHEHMHVAWSRIDEETLTAKHLPFFKRRLNTISRELEERFDLEPVRSRREDKIKFAPTKAEQEQARRLGLDVHGIRNTIRSCYEHSDCGVSFQAALESEGLTLARGDRRDFVVIDQAGGLHSLGKRILDESAAKIRDRLSDITREQLPTVEAVRASIEIQKELSGKFESRESTDLVREEGVVNAGIEKGTIESHAREPVRETKYLHGQPIERDGREERVGVNQSKPEWISAYPQYQFENAAREIVAGRGDQPPQELKGMSRRIMGILQSACENAEHLGAEAKSFSAVLYEEGIALAQVTKEEAERSQKEADLAKAEGSRARRYEEGEIVAVTAWCTEFRRDGEIQAPQRIYKLNHVAAEIFKDALENDDPLQGIEATVRALDERAEERAERTLGNEDVPGNDWSQVRDDSIELTGAIGMAAVRTVGSLLDLFCTSLDSIFEQKPTPEKRRAEKATQERTAEPDVAIDYSRSMKELAERRRQEEQGREAALDRERGGRER